MTVGELAEALAKLNPQQNLLIAVDGAFAPVIGVTGADGAPFVILRGQGKKRDGSPFTVGEEGIITHLSRLGLSDEAIGEVLGRPPESVKRKRKALGVSTS